MVQVVSHGHHLATSQLMGPDNCVQLGGQRDVRMGGWRCGLMGGWTNGWMSGWPDGGVGGGRMDGWTEGGMEEWADGGWMVEWWMEDRSTGHRYRLRRGPSNGGSIQ